MTTTQEIATFTADQDDDILIVVPLRTDDRRAEVRSADRRQSFRVTHVFKADDTLAAHYVLTEGAQMVTRSDVERFANVG